MAKRKTVEVAELVKTANRLLALPDANGVTRDLNADFRQGVIAMVEYALHTTETYNGFSYLSSEKVTADEPHTPNTTYLRIGYDETRRAYYLPRLPESASSVPRQRED
jgi:hypothetical protein